MKAHYGYKDGAGDFFIIIDTDPCVDCEHHGCVEACPEGVFMTYPRNKRGPGKAADNWAIIPSFSKLCTGCRICEEVCPENALTVSAGENSVV